eukprot:scaffold51969_cov61-Phaeocystis_antarctica.AAC.3
MAVRQPRLRHAMRAQLRTPSVSKSAVSSSVRLSMLASALGAATALEDDAAAAFARRRGGIPTGELTRAKTTRCARSRWRLAPEILPMPANGRRDARQPTHRSHCAPPPP